MTTPQIRDGALQDSQMILGMPAADYHADVSAQSCSLLKEMLASPAHYRAQFFEVAGKSKARDFGTLVHTLVLEPQRLAVEYAVFSGRRDGRDAEFKEFARSHPDVMVVDEFELKKARDLASRMLERPLKGRPFGDYVREGDKEVVIYFTDPSGVRCRVRIDLWHPELVCDLKTSITAVPAQWLRKALGYHYDMQAYMYSLASCLYKGAEEALPFYFMVGESGSPHAVSPMLAGPSFLENGGKKYKQAVEAFAACSQVNHWPDSGEDAVLELEPWMVFSDAGPAWRKQLDLRAAP